MENKMEPTILQGLGFRAVGIWKIKWKPEAKCCGNEVGMVVC